MNIEDARVLVGSPNYNNLYSSEVYASHMHCVAEWTKMGLDFNVTVVGRTFVHFARTQICEAAVKGRYTHIFWLDDDAVIEPDILPRFIKHDKDVVIAPYPMRRYPFQIGVLASTKGDFHDHQSYRNWDFNNLDKGLVECDGGGTHCMLVKTSCLLKGGDKGDNYTQYPPKVMGLLDKLSPQDRDVIDHYVGNLPDEELSLAQENDAGKPYFMMPKTGTEDMYFCYRLKKKGVKIWCDTDVFANHVGFPEVITKNHHVHATKQFELAQEEGHVKAIDARGGIQSLEVQEVHGGGAHGPNDPGDVPPLRGPTVDSRRASSLV